MTDAPELPPRPLPPRGLGDTLAGWLQWVGFGRVIATAVSVLVVIAGGVWMLRAPSPATETTLPLSSGSSPTMTLAPPSAPPVTEPSTTSVDAVVPDTVVVHVAGAVVRPGIYELPSVMRVADAVGAAGGPTPDGDLDSLNLASPIGDGQRVYVPRRGEVDPASVPSGGATPAALGAPGSTSQPVGPIDLNTATAEDFEMLPGVGPATAAAIVEDRAQNGPFASVDDLDRVPGIGPAKLAALRDQVRV